MNSSSTPTPDVARDTTHRFFQAYNAHDARTMKEHCAPDATFRYVAASGGLGTEQPVDPAAVGFWTRLWTALPDLKVRLTDVAVSTDGRVCCVVFIGGTQAEDAFGVENQGRAYWLEHLFVLRLDRNGRIQRIDAYYDDATWYAQLGRTQIDPLPSADEALAAA